MRTLGNASTGRSTTASICAKINKTDPVRFSVHLLCWKYKFMSAGRIFLKNNFHYNNVHIVIGSLFTIRGI